MNPVEAAILRTVLYADLFNFPLTLPELHHYLISRQAVSLDDVQRTLQTSASLAPLLTHCDGLIFLHTRPELLENRRRAEDITARLWPAAQRYAAWFAHIPFVRMVALTGALAVHNPAPPQDDLDYLLVTSKGRVWFARACAILIVRVVRLRSGLTLCPNYILAENDLAQRRRDSFMAHEITQMIPLYGTGIHQAFRAQNDWVAAHLPNATVPLHPEAEWVLSPFWRSLKNTLESLFVGRLGDWLEAWEYRRKMRRFAPQLQTPHSSALLDAQHVKGHFNDHGHPILRRYQEQLAAYGLDAE